MEKEILTELRKTAKEIRKNIISMIPKTPKPQNPNKCNTYKDYS